MARYNDGAFIQLFGSLSMVFFSKLFKSKQASTNKENNKTAQVKQNTVIERPDIASIPTDELRQFILSQTDATYCLEALERISNEEDHLQIAMQHTVAAVRNAAAENINSRELLQKLQTHSKSKDKALFRLCKSRLADMRATQQENKERQERIEYLVSQARYLTRVGYQPEFSGKLQVINQEWEQLSEFADATTVQSMQTELDNAALILQQNLEEEEQALAAKTAKAVANKQQQQSVQKTVELLEQANSTSLDELTNGIQQLEQHWNEAFRQHKPDAEVAKEFESNLQLLLNVQSALTEYQQAQTELNEWLSNHSQDSATLQKLLKQGERWLKSLSWPQTLSSPEWHQQLLEKVNTLKQQQAALLDAQDSKIQQIKKQLVEFEQALKAGLTKEAAKFNRQIQQGLKQISPNKATALQQQLRGLQAQLQELRDWAGFATTPKKESLIASMKELIGADIAPAILADKIRDLQEEWKTLSTTGTGNDRELWESFNQAADKAFEPCKAYFAEQTKLRDSYVELRHKLINELSTYELGMDWDNADWKVVQKTLDKARETFRSYGPIERSLHKETQDRFNEICDRIYANLKQEYEHNINIKNEIVQKAEQLLQSEELQGVVDQVKALQSQWKNVGVTPRGPDQKLWREFRKSCDAIFARLDEQRAERKSEISEAISAAETIVNNALNASKEEIKSLLREANEHLQEASLPKNVHQALSKKLSDARQALDNEALKQQQAGLIARLNNLHADDDAWQQACTLPLPKGYSADLFEQARAEQPSAAESALDLCLLLEIAKDKESPEADHSRRMELQVQRLANGLGQSLSTDDEVRSLIERWLTVKASDELTERFVKTLEA